MPSPIPSIPGALATPEAFLRRFGELGENEDPLVIAELLVEATAHIEDLTDRRLAPFSKLVYQDRLFGIDPDEYGNESNLPIDIYAALGISKAQALGATGDLVRHFWLPEYAPRYPELWTYSIQSIEIWLTYGNVIPVDLTNGGIIGDSPAATDGHMWLRLGTFAPEGSRVNVTYSGGYTVGIPPALSRACLFQAAKFAMLESEPQVRSSMDHNELDNQIARLIAPWVRG